MREKEEITVKDEDKLIELFRVISWLDEKRWKPGSNPGAFDVFIKTIEDLQPAQQILAHWLIYITNRGKDAVTLWENNSPAIKELVEKYEGCSTARDVSILCKERLFKYDKKKEEWKLAIQAYPADVKSIWRTLVILLDESYQKNIIRFMTEKLSEWGTENFCSKVAFRLYLLSYSDIGNPNKEKVKELLNGGKRDEGELNTKMEEAKAILKNSNTFKDEYEKWFGSDQRWRKRLWAALRDYKKHQELARIFTVGIEEETKRKFWEENFRKEQLELPGDTWNNKPSFRENIFIELIELKDIPNYEKPKNLWMSRVVRQLYDRLKELDEDVSGFYPEQFDVTFDFVSRMCEKRLCDFCPFSEKGMKSISKICNPSKDKYCPVALFTCGYFAECEEKGCAIKDGVGKGICQGRKQAGVSK